MTAVTGPTPGQALHDSLRESAIATFGPAGSGYETWDQVPQWQRDRMEDAGKAAVEAARLRQPEELREAMAETRQLRDLFDAITTDPDVIKRLGASVVSNWRRRAGLKAS